MEFDNLTTFRNATTSNFGAGPFAMVVAEDQIELASTIEHVENLGFATIFIVAPVGMALPPARPALPEAMTPPPVRHVIRHPTRAADTVQVAVNALIEKVPGAWVHYCFNAEYLFFPFCEDRSIRELIDWVAEERRQSVLTYIVDLYAGDLSKYPNAVSREAAMLDGSGYYAGTRRNADGEVMDRQLDFHGGLRWRFEEHVAKAKRRIDRVSLFQAKPGLKLRANHTASDEEMNTFECPWHNSLTGAVASFRVAKALRTNPGSRDDIGDFRWHRSEPFRWSSLQLMELGLMEPGQWF